MIPRHLLFTALALLLAAMAMGFYAAKMRGRVSSNETPHAEQSLTPPESGPTEQVTLFVAHDDQGVVRPQGFSIPLPSSRQQRAEELLRALISTYEEKDSPHPLNAGAELRGVYLVETSAVKGVNGQQPPPAFVVQQSLPGSGLAVIDLNAAFADGHRSGIMVETLTILSLVETLKANIDGIHRVRILVGGQVRDTLAGHADLSNEFDADAIAHLGADLSPGE